jgi:RNA:NAD 2'-phosphotransferase (TPT1/KptA family)
VSRRPGVKLVRRGGMVERHVKISKALSWLLRHKPGFVVRSDGYVPVEDVLPRLHLHVKLAELRVIVDTNDKQRFEMDEEESPPLIDSLSMDSRSGYSHTKSQ